MKSLILLYTRFATWASFLQSPFLLAVRLYWGWQFMMTGWGKLHHLDKITSYFMSLNIPLPGLNAPFVSALEFVGGILLMLGLGSRLIALMMTINMLVAYIAADHEALFSIFSDSDKFVGATPFSFLIASLIILIFGPGFFSIDTIFEKYGKAD